MPPAIPAAPPSPKSALAFFAALFALVLPDLLAQGLDPRMGLAWSELFTLLLPTAIAAAGSNLRVLPYLGLSRPRAAPVLCGALLGAAAFVAADGLMALWVQLLPLRLLETFDVGRIFQASPAEQLAVTAVATLLAPLCEEAAFRGYLQRTLALRRGPAAAIGLGALLFALRHLDPVRFPALVFLGAVFGWAAWRSGSTWPAIAAHAANNALAAGVALAGGRAPPARAGPTLGEALGVLAVGAVTLAALAWLYRRLTPAPPGAARAVIPRDALDPSIRFRPWRVPAALVLCAALGLAALAALALAAGSRGGAPR